MAHENFMFIFSPVFEGLPIVDRRGFVCYIIISGRAAGWKNVYGIMLERCLN